MAEGDFLTTMGPSGAGKSTLLDILGLRDEPSAVSYLLYGQAVHAIRARQKVKSTRF